MVEGLKDERKERKGKGRSCSSSVAHMGWPAAGTRLAAANHNYQEQVRCRGSGGLHEDNKRARTWAHHARKEGSPAPMDSGAVLTAKAYRRTGTCWNKFQQLYACQSYSHVTPPSLVLCPELQPTPTYLAYGNACLKSLEIRC